MQPPDLPGFYFDSEKKRYFPVSHQKRAKAGVESAATVSSSSQSKGHSNRHGQHQGGRAFTGKVESTPEDKVLALLHQREISGNRRYGNCTISAEAFQGQYLEMQTLQPRVWNYSDTENWTDGGLEQLRVSLQTAEGKVEADVMIFGGSDGRLGVWEVAEAKGEQDLDRYLPLKPDLWTGEAKDAPVLWPLMYPVVRRFLPSKISSVKRLNEWPDSDRLQNGHRLDQMAIITTLGNGSNGGVLFLLCPTGNYLQQDIHAQQFRLTGVVTTHQSVWTAESNPHGKVASLGMSSGSGTVDLERGQMSWLCRSSSDVLSQQFDSSGNVLLCGFRNGVISTVDLRLPQPKSRPSFQRHAMNPIGKWQGTRQQSKYNSPYVNTKISYAAPHQGGKGKRSLSNVDKFYCSHSTIMQMNSAICSLKLLRSCEWYLLASAMNGDIQQWDRRFVERGALRTFEGHNNSHTLLQLGVDPTERLLVSGGEDSAVRVWSLASGRLLYVKSGLDSPVTTVSWPISFRTTDSSQWGGFWEEPPFEDDNSWALWMGSSSGLLHMHGAAR